MFVNPTLIQHWKGAAALYGILVVLADLFFGAILIYIRRRRTHDAEVSLITGARDLALGICSLVIAIAVHVLWLEVKTQERSLMEFNKFIGFVIAETAAGTAVLGGIVKLLSLVQARHHPSTAQNRNGHIAEAA